MVTSPPSSLIIRRLGPTESGRPGLARTLLCRRPISQLSDSPARRQRPSCGGLTRGSAARASGPQAVRSRRQLNRLEQKILNTNPDMSESRVEYIR